MKELNMLEVADVSGGTDTPPVKNPDGTYSCPTGTFPSQLPDGSIVCSKPN